MLYFWAENKERNGETPLRTGKYFEWIIKQLLNSAFVGYEEFCRSRKVLSTSSFGLLDLQHSSYPTQLHSINRGYYTVAKRYEFYVRVARTISHKWAQRTSEILLLPREHKIHIFEPTCNVLFIIWRLNIEQKQKGESWRHWTIRHSQRWHIEDTPLGSRMKWRMESTYGLVPSKTLSSIW